MGCALCKARRIKCQEERPQCQNVGPLFLGFSLNDDSVSIAALRVLATTLLIQEDVVCFRKAAHRGR